jgi:hypothetical protein
MQPARHRVGLFVALAVAGAFGSTAAERDVRKSFGEALELKFGTKYITSSRHVSFRDWTNPGFFDGSGFGSLPIWNGDYRPVFPGKHPWSVPEIDEDKLLASPGTIRTGRTSGRTPW